MLRVITLVALYFFQHRQDCIVIGFLSDFLDQLCVLDNSLLIDNKNGPCQKPELLNQDTIGGPKRGVTMVREGLNLCYPGCAAPAFLSEWKIHADRQENDISTETACLFIEFVGFHVTDRSIEGRDRGKDTSLSFE